MTTVTDNKLAIIIPAMNESGSIASVLSDITAHFNCTVIVVDDASTDNTAQIARGLGACVLSHAINLGAWRATQTGIRYALKKGYERVVTCDADGNIPHNLWLLCLKMHRWKIIAPLGHVRLAVV